MGVLTFIVQAKDIIFIFSLYRDYKENTNCNGMPAPLLQGMHRQVNATRVCDNIGHIIVKYSVFMPLSQLIVSVTQNLWFCRLFVNWIFVLKMTFNCRNNECPACRTHCASRRSLRDDPNYDALISALYPDIDKYEEEVWISFIIYLLVQI